MTIIYDNNHHHWRTTATTRAIIAQTMWQSFQYCFGLFLLTGVTGEMMELLFNLADVIRFTDWWSGENWSMPLKTSWYCNISAFENTHFKGYDFPPTALTSLNSFGNYRMPESMSAKTIWSSKSFHCVCVCVCVCELSSLLKLEQQQVNLRAP